MRKKKIFICLSVLFFIMIFLYYENNFLMVTNIHIESDRLPVRFENFKIVQLSDLHSKMFGRDQQKLVSRVKSLEPDIIFFTGDLIDSNHYDEQSALKLIDGFAGIAPVYYVTGNHEFWSGKFASLEKKLQERNVKVLRNACESIERDGYEIDIVGIDDPAKEAQRYNDYEKVVSREMKIALEGSEKQNFRILLSHRPEFLAAYSEYGFDLIFSGHAHGGQVRIPFIGGVIAPDQGFWPRYSSGFYQEGNSMMIVNRGLGNSIIPQRIFNRPEIVFVSLRRE